ncbi:MAG: hypothetical protein ACFB9N_13655 [Geitlerinemataceae cyanobacterium]|mgnify:CR=1 FL=1
MSVDGDEKGKIVERLRQSLQPRPGASTAPPLASAAPAEDFDREDLDLLRRGADVYHVSLESSHALGKPLGLARRAWRKILKPLFIRQVHYNGANVRLLEVMQAKIDRLEADKTALHGEVQGRVAEPLSETVDRLKACEAQMQAMQARIAELEATEKQQSRAIVRLHRQVQALQAGSGQSDSQT